MTCSVLFYTYRSPDQQETKIRDVCGPLTQRLVAALVEDRVLQYNNQHNGGTREEQNGDGCLINRPGLVRALGLDGAAGSCTPVPMETRLRQVKTNYLLRVCSLYPFLLW